MLKIAQISVVITKVPGMEASHLTFSAVCLRHLYAFKYCELSAASSPAPAGHASLGPSSSLAPSPFSKPPEQENALVLPPSDWWASA